ncbi:MFS transporter [Chloroflexota bacterium]
MADTIEKKPRYFYGWNIVAASFLTRLSYAEHHSSMLGFFFKPFQNEFGWSRSAIAAVQTIARFMEALFAPIVGPLIDRYGPRVLIPIGAFVIGLAMLGVTQIDTLWQFYMLRGAVAAIGFSLIGGMVVDVAVNNWFIRKRGRAIAIGRLGGGISNIIFVPLTVYVIAASGWRPMFVIFALFTWLVVLIPSAILMRRRPEDMGLYPDGITPYSAETAGRQVGETPIGEAVSPPEPLWNRRELLVTGSFWLLTFCFAIDGFVHQGINISLAPYIQDLGYDNATLAAVMTFRPIVASLSLPLMGLLAEHAHRGIVRVIPFIVQSMSAFAFILADEPIFLWLAMALYGLGFSGVAVVQEVVWANYFGRLNLGLVRSSAYLIVLSFGAAGPIIINAVFDTLGSYKPAFVYISASFILTAFVVGLTRPPKAHRYGTATAMRPSTGGRRRH